MPFWYYNISVCLGSGAGDDLQREYLFFWSGRGGKRFGELFVSVIMCKVEEKQLEAALVEK